MDCRGVPVRPETRVSPTSTGHLAAVTDDMWGIWRWFCLRSAGFPAAEVLKLAAPDAAGAAGEALRAERELQNACAEAKRAIHSALDALRARDQWSDKRRRNSFLNALRSLDRGEHPALEDELVATAALNRFRVAATALQAAQRTYHERFDQASVAASANLTDIAKSELFKEALVWQNRRALHGSMSFAGNESAIPTITRRRRREMSVAKYLQRYCTKNDTIGFFGPVGWGQLEADPAPTRVSPGSCLLAKRTVYFEGWGIEALAEKLAQDRDLRTWLVPRRMPFIHLEHEVLHLPMAGAVRLPAKQAAVLRACTGNLAARDLVANVLRDPRSGLSNEAEVYQLLDLLSKQRRIEWTLATPLDLRPEDVLRRQLDRIGDDELRRTAAEPLEVLVAARDAVALAAGNADQLDDALQFLEEAFTRLTGVEPTRNHGQTYAARTLVYEECLRDVDVHIGSDVVKAMVEPLSLLLMSARWLSNEVARVYRGLFADIYTALVRKTGSPVVSLADFVLWGHEYFFNDRVRLLDPVVAEFQRRWADILALPDGQRRIQRYTDELRPRVLEAFQTAAPGWDGFRYHSPDMMIAAESPEAICSGEYQLVMGELHVGMNTLGIAALLSQHPAPDEMVHPLEHDLPQPQISPVVSKDWNITARTCQALHSPNDLRLLLSHDTAGADVPPDKALPVGALVVEQVDGALVVTTRDGRQRFGIFDVLSGALLPSVTDLFKMLPGDAHTPRVTIDRLVVARETWRCQAEDVGFPAEREESGRFLAAQRWRQELGVPRFVFVRTPLEKKPFFVDFESPILVEIFVQAARAVTAHQANDQAIIVSEMLPSFEHMWLPDCHGQRFASELRIAAVDLS